MNFNWLFYTTGLPSFILHLKIQVLWQDIRLGQITTSTHHQPATFSSSCLLVALTNQPCWRLQKHEHSPYFQYVRAVFLLGGAINLLSVNPKASASTTFCLPAGAHPWPPASPPAVCKVDQETRWSPTVCSILQLTASIGWGGTEGTQTCLRKIKLIISANSLLNVNGGFFLMCHVFLSPSSFQPSPKEQINSSTNKELHGPENWPAVCASKDK